ncbi:MAG: hypothetical protein CTY20_04350 [Hyphomicrobium sp.]|nr:MAG: hypothetical protein CTY20_04350 [Hyphomicrobium sp.]
MHWTLSIGSCVDNLPIGEVERTRGRMRRSSDDAGAGRDKAAASLPIAAGLAVLVAAALVGIAHFANLSDWMRAPDAWTYDWRTAHFAGRPDTARKDITVVTIDETSMERYASLSPVSRALQAKLVSALEVAGAKAIGLDFLYDRPTLADDDRALVAALKNAKIPVVVGAIDKRSVLRDRDPEQSLAYQERFIAETGKAAAHLYFVNAEDQGRFMIGDQVIRHRMPPSTEKPHRKGIAEALADAVNMRKSSPTTKAELIDWQRPPASGLDEHAVPILRVATHVPDTPSAALFGKGWEEYVRGRIVLVGGAFGDRDRHLTPLSISDHKKIPGVLIHAQILAQLIDGREVKTLPLWLEAALLVGTVLLGWLFGRRAWRVAQLSYRAEAGGLIENLLAGAAVFLVGVVVYALTGLIFPSATIYLAFMAGLLLGNPPRAVSGILR